MAAAKSDTKFSPTEIITPECRLAFPVLFKPKPFAPGDEPKFTAVLLLPPGTNLKPFEEAMKAASIKKFGKALTFTGRGMPIKDAGEKSYAGFEKGWTAISVSNPRKPAVVDQKRVPVTDEDLAYPGMWVRAYLNAGCWDNKGKGCTFYLNAVQLVRDDKRFDGRKDAEAVFEALEMPDDGSDLTGGLG